jgi:hypothetical protein
MDARTGKVARPKWERRVSKAAFALHHKNPFLFAYRIRADTARIEYPGITEFANMVWNVSVPKIGPQLSLTADAKSLAIDGRSLGACTEPGFDAQIAGLVMSILSTRSAQDQTASLLNDERTRHETFVAAAAALRQPLLRDTATAGELIVGGKRLHDEFVRHSGSLTTAAGTIDAASRNAEQELSGFERALGEARIRFPSCLAVLSWLELPRHSLIVTAGVLEGNRRAFHETRTGVEAQKKALQDLVTDVANFRSTIEYRDFRTDADVRLNVERKPVGAKDTAYKRIGASLMQLSGWRFRLAAGLVVADVAGHEFGIARQRRIAPPGSPADTTVQVVVQTNDASFRLMPMLALHTRLATLVTDWSLTLGATIRPHEKTADPEYFVGFGGVLFGDVFGSVGYYFGSEQTLGRSVRLGQEISGTSVPTLKSRVNRVGVLLSYGLRR